MARSTIDEINIQNFKFFSKLEKPIKLDGKHLLLYGENGSGKSSVYWALYTLMECALKEKDSEIEKYFQHDHDQRLTNIHLQHGSPDWVDPIIAIKLKDGTEYKVSLNEKGINKDYEAKKNNLASDFIYYRMLFRFYNFAHSETIDLFPLFLYDILPYIKFNSITYWRKHDDGTIDPAFETSSANLIWEFVKNGPQKNILNKKNKNRFPLKKEDQFKDYKAVVNSFKNDLNELITYINTQGNPILKDKLGYNIIFRLELKETPFGLSQQRFTPPMYEISLRVPDYEGVIDGVKRPHSFLNEAKLTAIALAIRLAILQKRLAEANLRILVLDDLLISLDMGNREKVLDIVMDKLASDYQVLLLTHDRNFYQFVQSKIDRKKQQDKWLRLEIYESRHNGFATPFIKEPKSNIQQAIAFLIEHEYEASGNSLRREAEDFVKRFLPRRKQFTVDLEEKNLDGKLNEAKKFAKSNGLDTTLFDKLINLNKFVFNKLSHDDFDVPIFRDEINMAFETFKKLDKLKFKKIIEAETRLHCEMSDKSGNNWKAEITVFDDLIEIKEEGKDSIITKGKMLINLYKNNHIEISTCEFRSLKERYEHWYNTSDGTKSQDFWDELIISQTGSKLRTIRSF